MTVPCNTGFSELAKFGVGEAADVFKYMAIGKHREVDRRCRSPCQGSCRL